MNSEEIGYGISKLHLLSSYLNNLRLRKKTLRVSGVCVSLSLASTHQKFRKVEEERSKSQNPQGNHPNDTASPVSQSPTGIFKCICVDHNLGCQIAGHI